MFKHQVVWITGASSGIGESLALAFAGQQARLVLSARREEELERVAQRCDSEMGLPRSSIMVLPLDVAELETASGKTSQVLEHFGQIDLLINNAGVSQRSLCRDTDLSVYQRLMDVDVMGQIALTKAVLPHMLERGRGHIAVTSSVAGKVGVRLRTGYCAAKHAVMGFFDALRAEVEDEGIQVSTIVPGFVATAVAENSLAADGSAFGQADEDNAGGMDSDKAAAVIISALGRGKREIPVGEGREMMALWLKRVSPELVFQMTKNRK
ncbi:SDR family oxidoreductase [Vreelandella utahensis]|uniref:SDR family oxidoreductase n=1 Tax=Vreelandella halophila TaxID=86177 RepID=UPI000986BEC2|nr:SDR family oxidoreductase [Halomonas utahensis]